MNNSIKLFVEKKSNKTRIDVFITKNIREYTRSYIKKLIEQNHVKINNAIINSPATKVRTKDEVRIKFSKVNRQILKPCDVKLNIVFEDKDLIIVNKPKGLVVHPGAGNYENTLANALIYKYKNDLSNINGDLRPGIVHRIDKDTSGLLVVAKNNFSHNKLGEQFSRHTIKRSYICLAWGVIRPLQGKIETLIARSKKNRQLMTVSEVSGKKAITNYKTIKVFNIKDIPKISLIECILETGRTHQIRVHLKYKGVSLLGDNQYGKKNIKFKKINQNFLNHLKEVKGQTLHAQTLKFIHPTKKKWIEFKSETPPDFKKMLNLLNKLSS